MDWQDAPKGGSIGMDEDSGVTFEHSARAGSPARAHQSRPSTTPNGDMWISFAAQVPLPPDMVPAKRSRLRRRSARHTKEEEG
jgi:hypothetical protein